MKLVKGVIPVLLGALLVITAHHVSRAFSGYFYVIPTSVSLRECASPHCDVLLTAYRGDKVEILARTGTGWSKVRMVDRSGTGWMPSDLLSFSPDLRAKAPPHYYVNQNTVALRAHPRPSAGVLAYLHFNEPVEMLGVTSGYAQVRELKTSQVGWVWPRYLSSRPLRAPARARHHRAPRHAPVKEKVPERPNAM
jgi:uncharacterized protein YgiM (DUF1202 family)